MAGISREMLGYEEEGTFGGKKEARR